MVELVVEGLLSTGPTGSSLVSIRFSNEEKVLLSCLKVTGERVSRLFEAYLY